MKNPNTLDTLLLAQRELRQFHSSDKESQALLEMKVLIETVKKNKKAEEDSVWSFIEKYYPNYESSDRIAEADDLSKLLNKEVNGAAEDLLHSRYDGDIHNPQIQIDYNIAHVEIYEAAIQTFLNNTGL